MLIALTGSIGSGKSLVLSLFKGLGVRTISSDAIVAELLTNRAVKDALAGLLDGIMLPDGTIDKRRMADIIFDNDTARQKVEAIIHQLVMEEIYNEASIEGMLVAEIPLLFETGLNMNVDLAITVVCNEDIAFKRLVDKGFSQEDIKRRLRRQMPQELKADLSDFVIDNSGPVEETLESVRAVYNSLKRRVDD